MIAVGVGIIRSETRGSKNQTTKRKKRGKKSRGRSRKRREEGGRQRERGKKEKQKSSRRREKGKDNRTVIGIKERKNRMIGQRIR